MTEAEWERWRGMMEARVAHLETTRNRQYALLAALFILAVTTLLSHL